MGRNEGDIVDLNQDVSLCDATTHIGEVQVRWDLDQHSEVEAKWDFPKDG